MIIFYSVCILCLIGCQFEKDWSITNFNIRRAEQRRKRLLSKKMKKKSESSLPPGPPAVEAEPRSVFIIIIIIIIIIIFIIIILIIITRSVIGEGEAEPLALARTASRDRETWNNEVSQKPDLHKQHRE